MLSIPIKVPIFAVEVRKSFLILSNEEFGIVFSRSTTITLNFNIDLMDDVMKAKHFIVKYLVYMCCNSRMGVAVKAEP